MINDIIKITISINDEKDQGTIEIRYRNGEEQSTSLPATTLRTYLALLSVTFKNKWRNTNAKEIPQK